MILFAVIKQILNKHQISSIRKYLCFHSGKDPLASIRVSFFKSLLEDIFFLLLLDGKEGRETSM